MFRSPLIEHRHLYNAFFRSIFIEFIGVALVNKIIYVSGVKFKIQLLNIVLCVHHPKSSLLPSPFSPLALSSIPHPPFLLVITILLSVSMSCFP